MAASWEKEGKEASQRRVCCEFAPRSICRANEVGEVVAVDDDIA